MFNWFVCLRHKKNAKIVQYELDKIASDLKQFKIINLNSNRYIPTLSKFPKFEKIVKKYDDLSPLIDQHNNQIQNLVDCFNTLINKEKDELLTYSQQHIHDLDAFISQINTYQIEPENSLSHQYQNIAEIIHEININFDYLQQCLEYKKRYEALTNALPDQYLDQVSAKEYVNSLKTIASNFNEVGNKYFSLTDPNEVIKQHNNNFIEHHRNDQIFKNFCNCDLDPDQCKAILCDAQSNLIIAGAGTGKTLTICGKVKYLIETKKANPNEILLLTFSNDSKDDLAKKIKLVNGDVKNIFTFHSLGLRILDKTKNYANTPEKTDKLETIIYQYLMDLLNDKYKLNQLFEYFAFYLQDNYANKHEKSVNKIKRSKNIKDLTQVKVKEKRFMTLTSDYVRSFQEMMIANYLYLNNIEFKYEAKYNFWTASRRYRQYYPDFYLPNYDIYIEHFGIDKNGQAEQYGPKGNLVYQKMKAWKEKIHHKHNTKLIETFSWEFDEYCALKNLENKLKENGINTSKFSQTMQDSTLKIIKQTWKFYPLTKLLLTFINHYNERYRNKKANGFNEIENILNAPECSWLKNKNRAKFFLSICREIYALYIMDLENNKKIDFADMILTAKDELEKYPERAAKFKYKYIIVDEFQDISQSRLELLKMLIKHGQAKLFAVGDDWQAIYRFSGCDINIILQFKKEFTDVQINQISKTHRNSQELQNIAGEFIKKNLNQSGQIDKSIISEFREPNPIQIILHKTNKLSAFICALYKIKNDAKQSKAKINILVLGRYNHDIDPISKSPHFEVKNNGQINVINLKNLEGVDITFKTIHGSKGLESEYVVLINGDSGFEDYKNNHDYYGFPSEKREDELLNLIIANSSKDQFYEERRLFYVALTRTKSKVYILSNADHPSNFVDEIKDKCLTYELTNKNNNWYTECVY